MLREQADTLKTWIEKAKARGADITARQKLLDETVDSINECMKKLVVTSKPIKPLCDKSHIPIGYANSKPVPDRPRVIRHPKPVVQEYPVPPAEIVSDAVRCHLDSIVSHPTQDDAFLAQFVITHPKTSQEITARKEEIYRALTDTIALWNEHQDDIMIADKKRVASLAGLLQQAVVDGPIPRVAHFYLTAQQGLDSVYLGKVDVHPIKEDDLTPKPDIPMPIITRYSPSTKEASYRAWQEDSRKHVSGIVYMDPTTQAQENIRGILHYTSNSNTPVDIELPDILVGCYVMPFSVSHTPAIASKYLVTKFLLSYTRPGDKKDDVAELVSFFRASQTLYHNGLVVEFHDTKTDKDYSLILWEGNGGTQVNADVYDLMDLGGKKEKRLVKGCWIPV